jgi:transcriptional repressor of dcmA and dcmR
MNELLDIAQAAALLNVSETSLRRWTNSGRLPCLRVGLRRERRFRRGDLLAFLEDSASVNASVAAAADKSVICGPSHGPATLPSGSHLCGLYASDSGRITLCVPFLLDGLLEGSVCFVAGLPRTRGQIINSLWKRRPSLRADIDAGRLIQVDYHRESRGQNKHWRSVLDETIARGAQSIRIVGDVWGMRSRAPAASLVQYESDFDELIARNYPVLTLCSYDVRRFSGVEVLHALKGHRDNFRYPLEKALA